MVLQFVRTQSRENNERAAGRTSPRPLLRPARRNTTSPRRNSQNENRAPAWEIFALGIKSKPGAPIRTPNKEQPSMTTNTVPQSALDGLVSCGLCGGPMSYEEPSDKHEALYTCKREHENPGQPLRISSLSTDQQVISSVLDALLTEKAVANVSSAIREYDEERGIGSSFPAEDITLLKENPYLFLRAVRGVENARNFLATFITKIVLLPDRATVQYAFPLPSDSPLAGAKEQEVSLSAKLPA